VVSGSVFVTESVSAATRVALRPPEVTVRAKAAAGDFAIGVSNRGARIGLAVTGWLRAPESPAGAHRNSGG